MPRYAIGQKVTVIKIVDGKEFILGYSRVTGYNENVDVIEFENDLVEPVKPVEDPVEPVKPVEDPVEPVKPVEDPVEPIVAMGVLKKVSKYIIDPDIDVQNIHEANLGLRPYDYYGSSFKGNGWKVEKYYNSKVRNRYTR
jgi:hypothetical protein